MTHLTASQLFTASAVRHACRTEHFRGPTSGCCPDHIQANLIVLPAKFADDFRGLCRRNPVCCPLLGENLKPGDIRLQDRLAKDCDVRKDAPGYNVYNDGKLVEEDISDVVNYWSEDSAAFLIGCSFSFEQALVAAGLPPRHQTSNRNVPMYKTNIPLCPSGVFKGNMVVSMRSYKPEDVERVRNITRPYIETHGEPIAWGFKAAREIGIIDVLKPEFGDEPFIPEGEIPVFWGCGVTPQLVVMSSPGVKGVCIGHAPGKMVCLDLTVKELLSERSTS